MMISDVMQSWRCEMGLKVCSKPEGRASMFVTSVTIHMFHAHAHKENGDDPHKAAQQLRSVDPSSNLLSML